jgi:hypothetical protein
MPSALLGEVSADDSRGLDNVTQQTQRQERAEKASSAQQDLPVGAEELIGLLGTV